MAIETIRLSQQANEQLSRLKRVTSIEHWNILCRWAFCVSLTDPTPPSVIRIPADSTVEMTWKVFGGQYHDVYLALLRQRCHEDGLDGSDETLTSQLRLHLHRGIGHLATDRDLRSIAALLSKAISQSA
jgi:DNA sulfur modification protein DndE